MIDYVHMKASIAIPPKLFLTQYWHTGYTDNGEAYYWHAKRGASLHYYPSSSTFCISGKIITLLYNTQVLNPDDLYGTRTDIFLEDINTYLNSLFARPVIDIATFLVSRIDYCFNVQTPYVAEYIRFFNRAFKSTNRGTRTNHVEEYGLDGSVYIKTRADYKNNERRNYVVNFYDKTARLNYQRAGGEHISQEDFRNAENILRLEVQCGFRYINEICKKNCIGKTFAELLSYPIALKSISSVYERVFHCKCDCHYYRYRDAKNTIPRRYRAALKTLEIASMNNSILGTKHIQGRKVISEHGIYPYHFIKKTLPISMLPNPIALIEAKLKELEEAGQ